MLSTQSFPKEQFNGQECPAKISQVNAFPDFYISIPNGRVAIVVVPFLDVNEDNKDVYNMLQI